MPVLVNSSSVPPPSPTPLPPQPRPCKTNTLQHIIQPRTIHVEIVTPRRKIIATALRGPLQVSSKALQFTMLKSVADCGAEMGTCEVWTHVDTSCSYIILFQLKPNLTFVNLYSVTIVSYDGQLGEGMPCTVECLSSILFCDNCCVWTLIEQVCNITRVRKMCSLC